MTIVSPTREDTVAFVESPGERGRSQASKIQTGVLHHLVAGLIAVLATLAALFMFARYAEGVEKQYIHAMAPLIFEQKSWGTVLQRAALQEPDLLMLYGGSELRTGASYRASLLFQTYPTGFNVFSVGLHGEDSIMMIMQLSANGDLLRGKKIGIFITPYLFLQPNTPPEWYLFNFSDLNGSALMFDSPVELSIKQAAAKQMLLYPRTLTNDPVLHFGLQQLASGSLLGRLIFESMLPLGRIHLWTLKMQDHYAILEYIADHPDINPNVPREPQTLNWPTLLDQATTEYARRSDNNPWGVEDVFWATSVKDITKQKGDLPDDKFQKRMENSQEWSNLDLLLRELHELGAQPLLLTVPLHGPYYDYRGTSSQARTFFYEKMRQIASPYGVNVVAFEGHEYDKYFLQDTFDHPSQRGWVYFDQILDGFYHGSVH